MPISRTNCPHCARPQYFPNVDLATALPEKNKIDQRHQLALADVNLRECADEVAQFEALCAKSVAIFSCSVEKLYREVASGTDVFETFSDLERLRLNAAPLSAYNWAKLRPQAEIELFGSHAHLDKVHYACLSLDGVGLTSYGDCTVELAEPMIAHRASCFEGNTAIVYAKNHSFESSLRSDWSDRHRMCTAVLAGSITAGMDSSQFPSILVQNGATSADDRFIEVHVFGSMTARTFSSVRVKNAKFDRKQNTLLRAVREKLALVGVQVK